MSDQAKHVRDYIVEPYGLVVYTGPMFAGKSTGLILEAQHAKDAGRKIQAFKPAADKRYGEGIVSHDGVDFEAETCLTVTSLTGTESIMDYIEEGTTFVVIDEAQFFPKADVWVETLISRGISVVVSGLDLRSDGRPFDSMPSLLAMADHVYKLRGVCMCCGGEATRTFRKLNAPIGVWVGGAELYEPRCLKHWLEGRRESLLWTQVNGS